MRPRGRAATLGFVLLCLMPLAGRAQSPPPMPGAWQLGRPPADAQALAELLRRGEQALAAGDAAAARSAFEEASAKQHSAEVEIGATRTLMLEGEYRQALAFAAHTAGAHPEVAQGAVLYARLLALSGMTAVAAQVLERAAERSDARASIEAWRSAGADAVWLRPAAHGETLPPSARTRTGAWLLEDGIHALAPALGIDGCTHLWVRNGIGRTVAVSVERRMHEMGLVLLRLEVALPSDAGPAWAARDPFPGSPLYAGTTGQGDAASPAWPQLQVAFAGAAGEHERRLGVDLPGNSAGAGVLDTAGHFVGLSVPAADSGHTNLLGVAELRRGLAAQPASAPLPTATGSRPVDEIYEHMLLHTLTVLGFE